MGTCFELGTDGPIVIVTAVDGSPTSLRAGAYAAGLARRQHSSLVAVHVASPSAMASFAPSAAGAVLEALEEVAADVGEQLRVAAERIGVALEVVVRRGDPFTEICGLCSERRADAVVVGASARVGHRLAGSVAVRLVRAGRWPVTVVP